MNTYNHSKSSFSNPFSALKHKDFRYYWFGLGISMIGTWMQNIAQPWLAYKLTQSPFLLSLVGALQFLPVLVLSLFAGAVIDKFPKKRILFITQSAALITTLILTILVWKGNVQYWHILVMATILGLVNTFDVPARQSFVIELVGKEDLTNAIALNSTAFNVARMLGPALAGFVMGYYGIEICFLVNSISFAAVIICLFFVKPQKTEIRKRDHEKILDNIKDGLKHIYKSKILFRTISITAIVATFAMNFSVLVPVFSKEILKQQEQGFGLLMSFLGAGSLCGAIFVAMLSKSGPRKLFIYGLPWAISLFLILTGLSNSFYITAICLALAGFSFVTFSSTANSTTQLNTTDEFRGRVMSVYALVFGGSTPIGNLYAGTITDKWGPKIGFIACGAIIILLMGLQFIIRHRKDI